MRFLAKCVELCAIWGQIVHLFVFYINLDYLRVYIRVCRIYGYCIRGARYILVPFVC